MFTSTKTSELGLEIIIQHYKDAEAELAAERLRIDELSAEAKKRAYEREHGVETRIQQEFEKQRMRMWVYVTECGLATLLVIVAGILSVFGPHEMSSNITSGLFGVVSTTLLLHLHFRGPRSAPSKTPLVAEHQSASETEQPSGA